MSYVVLINTNLDKLEEEVKRYINNGWKCTGGICVEHDARNGVHRYLQAMVR